LKGADVVAATVTDDTYQEIASLAALMPGWSMSNSRPFGRYVSLPR